MSRNPVAKAANKWTRRVHRWGAIAAAAPVLVVIATGVLLQLKKDWTWVQPATKRGVAREPTISFDEILRVASTDPRARVQSWADVERLDVQPDRGIVKVRARSRWEIQIDTSTGEILQTAYRRSDLIESIHDGSFFHDRVKLWVFLPSGVVLLGLWATGMYLWVLPHWARRARARRERAASEASSTLF